MPKGNGGRPGGGLDLLAPLGTLAALALPFFVLTLASADAALEVKVAAQGAGAGLVLLALALGARAEDLPPGGPGLARSVARAGLGLFLAFFAASFAAGLTRGRDPYDALPFLSASALFAWGATRGGRETSGRALGLLVGCGAFTGLLAALQRFAGVLRLPVEAPEPRFHAAALIGNPGDVGAALVLPGLLAAARLARGEKRLFPAAALAACLAGLSAAATLAPLAAFAAGATVLVLADARRRILPALGVALAAFALLAGTGVVARAARKVSSGDLSELTTQRDIGVLSALETIRSRPLLGVGPGGFASDFFRARLAAEERGGRRLVHRSSSAQFDNAHCDPLTAAAETGVPAALALATALAALLAGLASRVRREAAAPPGEALPAEALLASLTAILVLSLANFPIQIVPVSGPFALLAGLAFARVGGRLPAVSPRSRGLLLAPLALLLLAGTAARFAGSLALAHAESAMGVARSSSGSARAELVSAALAEGRRAVALRPRQATAHLALGSALAAAADLPAAVEAMERSRALEERAETLLNLGRLALAAGEGGAARPFFVRAVWFLPRLAVAVPAAADPDGVVAETGRLEAALPAGGKVPPPPPLLRLR